MTSLTDSNNSTHLAPSSAVTAPTPRNLTLKAPHVLPDEAFTNPNTLTNGTIEDGPLNFTSDGDSLPNSCHNPLCSPGIKKEVGSSGG